MQPNRLTGTIFSFKGHYGFITIDDAALRGGRIFFHRTELPRGRNTISPGTRVSFVLGSAFDQRVCATDLQLVEGGA